MSRPQRPNVVVVMSDDTPFRSIGYKGGGVLTPAIDRLRQDGCDLVGFRTTSAVCTPSRFTFLTGRYAGRCGAPEFRSGNPSGDPACITWNTGVTSDMETIGKVFQRAGYRTGYVGKWHNGVEPSDFPGRPYAADENPSDPGVAARLEADYAVLQAHVRSCGFDFAEGVNYANTDNRSIRSMQVHNHEWIAKHALEFLNGTGSQQPFFLHVATTAIHGPSHIDAAAGDPRIVEYGLAHEDLTGILPLRHTLVERLDSSEVEITHQSVGALMLDDVVGALRAKLEEAGLSENTIFLYLSDHGWDSAKATCCEAGLRVPAAVCWPGRIAPGSTCGAVIRHIDLLPTLYEFCGIASSDATDLDGTSRARQILCGAPDDLEETYSEIGYVRGLRRGKWKYMAFRFPTHVISQMESGILSRAPHMFGGVGGAQYRMIARYPAYWEQDRLHDLEQDPDEQVNLAGRFPEVLQDMKGRLARVLATFPNSFDLSPQPFLDTPAFRELADRTSAYKDDLISQEYYLKGAF